MIEADKYTIKEFAEMAGVSRQWLYMLWAEGKGPDKVIRQVGKGHRISIPAASGDRWLTRQWLKRARHEFQNPTNRTTTAKSAVEKIEYDHVFY